MIYIGISVTIGNCWGVSSLLVAQDGSLHEPGQEGQSQGMS